MSSAVTVEFVPFDAVTSRPRGGAEGAASVLVAFAGDDLAWSPTTREILGPAAARYERAAAAVNFKGKNGSAGDILAPHGLGFDRLIVLGTGKGAEKEAGVGTLPPPGGLRGGGLGRVR